MSLTPWQPTVRRIQDGESVEQATVNVPIDQLTQRDQHLYEKFEEINGKSVLISFGQPIHPDESFNSGELAVVYFKSEEGKEGVTRSITGFTSSTTSSLFSPKNSNYSFGITKTIYSKTVDLYTEGLCEFAVDMDDLNLGIIQSQGTSVEPFQVGPYYLSSKQPGKITREPSGIPVYVGYAVSKRKFLLHTNVDEFSQFFINYRYHLKDRVAGTVVEDEGTWQIEDSDLTKLGWVSANDAVGIPPTGAVFFYNIPISSIDSDTDLTLAEIAEAKELAKYIPPVPANFIQLFSDGVLVRYNDSYDSDGAYSVNEYGIWWHDNAVPPWGKRLFTSFSRFNPALRTQLVSSIKPFNTTSNKSANFIKFYNTSDVPEISSTGDLLVDIDPKFTKVGAATTFTSPATTLEGFTAGQAIASLEYIKETGAFKTAITPVVAKIQGVGDIGVTESETSPGVWSINYRAQGITGQVDSIEPINARLEFIGLNSYMKLPAPTSTPYGFIGKIVLPKGYISQKQLKLILHVFGDKELSVQSTNRTIALSLEYSSVSANNAISPTTNKLVNSVYGVGGVTDPDDPTGPLKIRFSLASTGSDYTAYTVTKIVNQYLYVPATYIGDDTTVNFKIMRVAPGANGYDGNIGVLATYWEIVNN